MSLTKCTPTLVVEWTYKHGAKDELILSCTEHEFKLSSLCVFCAAICVRAQLSMNSSLGPMSSVQVSVISSLLIQVFRAVNKYDFFLISAGLH